jgi:flagellar hook-associated protein 2
MDPIATFSGLASGIDFRTLVDEIIRAESGQVRLAEARIIDLERRLAAWDEFRAKVSDLDDAVAGLADGTTFETFVTSTTGSGVSATALAGATPASYQVEVLQLATQEKLGSGTFATRDEPLGLSGEFIVGGQTVRITADESLEDIARILNTANSGTSRSGVSASILRIAEDEYRLMLTADQAGAEGVDLVDGPDSLLRSLGFLDETVSVKHATVNGARSDAFSDGATAMATLMELVGPPAAGAVTIGTTLVTLDLSSMSLSDIAQAINEAAMAQGTGVSASVIQEEDDQGNAAYRLDITGAGSFGDTDRILEALGVLEGGRGGVAQQVQGNAFTNGDATTTATGTTKLKNLWSGGSPTNVTEDLDTLTLVGTRGDGSTFSKTYTIGKSDDLQDLVDALNDATDAFGAGSRTATASISADGRLVVTDDLTGDSDLGLTIVANNEGGGSLDFGDFDISRRGGSTVAIAGQDAEFLVDGAFITRDSNTVADVIEGVTLELTDVTSSPVNVDVDLNVEGITTGVREFVDAFNALQAFVADQASGAGAAEGVLDRPLSGDSIVRDMRSAIRAALESTVDAAVGGTFQRLADIGIEVNKDGQYDFDGAVLDAALASDPSAVRRLLGVFGQGSVSTLDYFDSTEATQPGDYAVEITQLAGRASVVGTGFGGTYSDDGTPDALIVRDLGSNSEYSVALADGMTLSEIVDALNVAFNTRTTHVVQATTALYADGGGTVASDTTLLQDLHDAGGANLGVANGDTLTISGTGSNGGSLFHELTLTDVGTQTLGDLKSEIQAQVGTDVTVSIDNGFLTVRADEPGGSLLTLSVSSDNAGGGALSFGSIDVTTQGRGTSDIVASDAGGQLQLDHQDYGALAGFEVSFTAGGADGTASLGLPIGVYTGTDVQGTIGGLAATGRGQLLTGADDTAVEGLVVRHTGAELGAVGEMTFSRGSIDAVAERLDARVGAQNDRIERMEGRLERRREMLIRRFSALEEAMARAQTQMQWLTAQLASLPQVGGGGSIL